MPRKAPSINKVQSLMKEKKVAASKSKFIIFKAKNKYHWKLVVRGRTLAHSALPGFASVVHAKRNADSLAHHAATAKVVENGE